MKTFRVLLIIIVLFIVAALVVIKVLDQPLPEGSRQDEADKVARKIMDAVNVDAWDTTKVVAWQFPGPHDYIWDKKRNYAEIEWNEYRVLMDLDQVDGIVYKNGERLQGDDAKKAIQDSWEFWCNDSYWLNAVVKMFDPGTERSLVEMDEREGLKVTYTSGGSTPGDSYIWFYDENYLPEYYKMWVSILPVGGVKMSWEGWIELETGAKIATKHKSEKGIELELKNIRSTQQIRNFFGGKDPFTELELVTQ